MEYDYEKFLSDSSDDYPKYADGIVVPDPVQQIRQQQADIKEGCIRQSLGNPLPNQQARTEAKTWLYWQRKGIGL